MLDLMRRKKRLKFILWLVIFALGISMMVFFVPNMNMNGGSDSSAATVDGHSIPIIDARKAYAVMLKNYGNKIDAETAKQMGLPSRVLQSLITGKVIEIIAERMGLSVTDSEVQRAIEAHPNLQDQGKFIGLEAYKAILSQYGITLTDFESNIRLSELSKKVESIISDAVEISDSDIKDDFSRTNQEMQVYYILLKKDDFKKRVKPTEPDLQAYFEGHKEAYKVKETRRIQYLLVQTSQLIPTISVSEQEILSEWNQRSHADTVQVAHILIRPDDPSKIAEAKTTADKVLEMAKSGKDFSALAKSYSKDSVSAAQGGVLTPFQRGGGMPKEFEDAAFALKPGEISGIVQTEAGYHILKLLRHDTPTLESSRSSIIDSIQLKKAQNIAKGKAEEAARLAEKQKDFKAVGASLGVAADLRETGLFNQEDNAFQFGISQTLKDAAFELKEINAIGKAVDHPLGYAVPKLLEVKMARPGEFAESRTQVERDFTDNKARELMQAEANKISEQAAKQGNLDKVAKEMGWNIKSSQSFKYEGTPDPEIGSNPAFNSAAFDLAPGGVSSPIALMDNVAVLQYKSRTPFDEAAFQKEKSKLREKLLTARKDTYFQEYLTKIEDEMEKAGKIRINAKALDAIASARY
jgi:peptidyl-prolyl cis-trans isomerase D